MGHAHGSGFRALIAAAWVSTPVLATADEGGVSFWTPGTYGNLAAIPSGPGWNFTLIPYYAPSHSGAAVATARLARVGKIEVERLNDVAANSINYDAYAGVSLGYDVPLQAIDAQLAFSLSSTMGRSGTAVTTVDLRSGAKARETERTSGDSVVGFGDMVPQAALYWSRGPHNLMLYGTGNIPIGQYDKKSLANLGIGHAAVDGGAGYTFLDKALGYGFSAAIGATYNFTNPATGYKSGVDLHLGLGASKYLTDAIYVGPVGYFYKQIGCDSGAGARLGCFRSRVAGAGAAIGYNFPLGDVQGSVELKAYGEFAAQNRAAGWNAWLTVSVSP